MATKELSMMEVSGEEQEAPRASGMMTAKEALIQPIARVRRVHRMTAYEIDGYVFCCMLWLECFDQGGTDYDDCLDEIALTIRDYMIQRGQIVYRHRTLADRLELELSVVAEASQRLEKSGHICITKNGSKDATSKPLWWQ